MEKHCYLRLFHLVLVCSLLLPNLQAIRSSQSDPHLIFECLTSHLSRFSFATVLSVYNKWMFSHDHFGFPYPLFVTTIHMFIQFILATALRFIHPHFRPEKKPTLQAYGCVNATDCIRVFLLIFIRWTIARKLFLPQYPRVWILGYPMFH